MPFVRIAVNVPALSGTFDYSLPPALQGVVGSGSLVTVPFGRQTVQGVVLDLVDQPAVEETRQVLDLLDPLPVVTPAQIALARWMAETYLAPLPAMLDLMLPAGLGQQADTLYELRRTPATSTTASIANRLIKMLTERGPLRGRQIDRHFSRVDWKPTARQLVRQGVLLSRSVLPSPTARPKTVRTARLAVTPEVAEASIPSLGRTETSQRRRQAALRCLMRDPGLVNVAWLYAESGCNLADLQELAGRDLVILQESELWRDPLERIDTAGLSGQELHLTPDQQIAWDAIEASFKSDPQEFLLQGVTGSGKTELYLRAVAEALRHGRSAIILVPEIAITPQTVRRFMARFPGQVGLLHSKLSPGERYDTWRRCRQGLLKVVIGPRSALFAPLPNPGLIVADECHDGSYYQSEVPFYHAIHAARHFAQLCGAVCLLGSATPAITLRYEFEHNGGKRLVLPVRIPRLVVPSSGEAQPDPGLPPVTVVDMRQELQAGERGIFSRPLRSQIEAVLQRGEQGILFLNRRGTATYVFCRSCGFVAKCPNCDTPLTHHDPPHPQEAGITTRTKGDSLTCHRCGYQRKMLTLCPACGGNQLRAYGLGSEKVEAEVRRLYPAARTLRWDWETTRQKDSHEIILGHFAAHRADLLVGTQMLAKGLDLPLVTLVGIVLADVGLTMPDPFAAERTFNLLTQVAGRAGRSERGGRVILQTFLPEHYAIRCASGHDVEGFYTIELEQRRRLAYPPFTRLVRLEYRHYENLKAETEARRMADLLINHIREARLSQTDLVGPAPCFFSRLGGEHRWQIILRGPQPGRLVQELRQAGTALNQAKGWRVEVDPVSLL